MKSCEPRIFCAEIGNLCSESAAYFKKLALTLADYALNYAIAYSCFSEGTVCV